MSDQSFNNDAGLSKLRSHLDTEQYGAGTVSQYMAVARRFLADLNKQRVAITAVRPEDIDRYLQQAPWMYPLRHEDSPDYRHWRSTPIHMLLRLVQGRWPPVSTSITSAAIVQQEICEAYSVWMIALRGLPLPSRLASMGPRSADRGILRRPFRLLAAKAGFNGAAIS